MGARSVAKPKPKSRTIWYGSMPITLPIEPLTVRIAVAIHLTGIGRSKIYELIKAGKIDTVKVGASTLITVASLKKLTAKAPR